MPADDGGDGDHDLGRLGDLLHLRKVIDALSGRHVELAPPKESVHAIETGSCPTIFIHAKADDRARQNLRLDPEVWAAIDAARMRRAGSISRNTWITEAIAEKSSYSVCC